MNHLNLWQTKIAIVCSLLKTTHLCIPRCSEHKFIIQISIFYNGENPNCYLIFYEYVSLKFNKKQEIHVVSRFSVTGVYFLFLVLFLNIIEIKYNHSYSKLVGKGLFMTIYHVLLLHLLHLFPWHSWPLIMFAGWSSLCVRVPGRPDDSDWPKTQRRRHHCDGACCGADEVHLSRSHSSLQHPSAAWWEDMRDRRAKTRLQWGGGTSFLIVKYNFNLI